MTEYTSFIIYRKEWALKWYSFIIVSLGLSALSNFYLKSRPLTISFLALTFVSFLFIKIVMNYFTRKALIKLDNDKISFDIFKLKDDNNESFVNYSFFDIKSYNIQFPTSRFACLILNFNSGSKKEFSFLTRRFNDSQSDTDKIIESIHTSFKQFNIQHKQDKTIVFEPSFYASKKGLYTIVSLVLLSIITIVLAIKLVKNLPATFVGAILIIGQLIIRRSTDLTFYEKMTAD